MEVDFKPWLLVLRAEPGIFTLLCVHTYVFFFFFGGGGGGGF